MPSKKRKYNARFPAGRIKKIMQTDEEVGKVAQAVPVIISRTLELFVESLLTKTLQITMSKSAKTLSPSHMKQCILSESRFDFLKDLVKTLPDSAPCEDEGPAKPVVQQNLHSPAIQAEKHYFELPHSERSGSNPAATSFEPRLVASAAVATCPNPLPLQAAAAAADSSRTPVQANFYTDQLSSSYLGVSQSPRSSPPTLVVDEDYDT